MRPDDRISQRFRDRRQAGERLAVAVAGFVRGDAVVGGIPRGGVVVAAPVAAALNAPLVPIYARKLPWPLHPELAFGAIDDDGEVVLEDEVAGPGGLEPQEIDSVRRQVWNDVLRRRRLYGASSLVDWLPGRTVVLVDDGLATGLTMRAALAHARRHGARRVVVAVPCASDSAARWFRHGADQFIALIVDPAFMAVGSYYDDFTTVQDQDVVAILDAARTSADTQVLPGP